jgi:glycosyltransferase involved in cell wall biosynthesis
VPEEPLVSIVTPSYNMAAFLPETIESVLTQDYPRIEYLVMDGGSTDGTLEILKRYGDRLRYVSAPDRGTADAINRGCKNSQGLIFAWLSADDTYLPGAVSAAVRQLVAAPEIAAVYGEAYWVDDRGEILRRYPTLPFDPKRLGRECFICQPACFVRRSAFERAGMLDSTLQSAFDYDLWIRMAANCRFLHLNRYLATSRMHRANKTLGSRSQVFAESFRILKRHYGYLPFQLIHAACSYRVDGRDQFHRPLEPSFVKYLLSLPFGCWHNRGQMGRFVREWWSVMTWRGFVRRLNDTGLGRALDRRAVGRRAPPRC